MFEGITGFTDRVIENASANEEVFNTFAGTTDASTCTTEGLSGAMMCIGNLAVNVGAAILLVIYILTLILMFVGICKVAVTEGGWAAIGALILFIIVGSSLYFLPQIFIMFVSFLISMT